MTTSFLPAEWQRQALIQLTWPHAETDWLSVLDAAILCFCKIAQEVAKRQPLLIVTPNREQVINDLHNHNVSLANITIAQCPTNDTWARDHAFITTINPRTHTLILNDYQFNGWGLKFAANHDNLINSHIFKHLPPFFGTNTIEYHNCLDTVLEGGSIESDGEGTLMTTTTCLLSPNRNNITIHEAEALLKQHFSAHHILWLTHTTLLGDDTDGHIDTIARFCNPTTIAYVKCYDPTDEHYTTLTAMEQELQAFRTSTGEPYTLIPLPLPSPCYDADGNRLPATYANFSIINGAVLVPTYDQPHNDAVAISQLHSAFPNHEIVGIDCRVLITQHGSLHCSTMQYPSLG